MVFNPKIDTCDLSQYCNCTVETLSVVRNPYHAVHFADCPPLPTCNGQVEVGNIYPNPANCSMFHFGQGYGLDLMPCSTGLVFNPDAETCDDPKDYNCTEEC